MTIDKGLARFAANALGNFLEFLDFASFGAVADAISVNFFKSDQSSSTRLLESLAIFGVAFVMRPLGGILIGYIGDVYGRSLALKASVSLMVLPSFLIGCLPNYTQAGRLSVVMLVILRLLQGVAAGGEVVGAFVHTLENSPHKSSCFWGGTIKASGNLGSATGLGLTALLRRFLSYDQFLSWGWRIPFWCGLPIGILCLWMRYQLQLFDESTTSTTQSTRGIRSRVSTDNSIDDDDREDYSVETTSAIHAYPSRLSQPLPSAPPKQVDAEAAGGVGQSCRLPHGPDAMHLPIDYPLNALENPLGSLNKWGVLVCLCFSSLWGVGYYSACVWQGYFLTRSDLVGAGALTPQVGWLVIFISQLCLCACLVAGGWVGDRVGCARAQIFFSIVIFVVAVPAYVGISSGRLAIIIPSQLLLASSIGLYGGILPFLLCAQFPPPLRYTGVGLGYNLSHAIFSSTCTLVQTYLIIHTSHGGNNDVMMDPIRSLGEVSLNDRRLRPAYYLQLCALVVLCVRFAQNKIGVVDALRREEFGLGIWTSGCEVDEKSTHSAHI